jgi:hypothetical protein
MSNDKDCGGECHADCDPYPACTTMTEELDQLKAAARAHGEESSPDMEIGDLQAILFSCCAVLTDKQKEEVVDDCAYILEWLE